MKRSRPPRRRTELTADPAKVQEFRRRSTWDRKGRKRENPALRRAKRDVRSRSRGRCEARVPDVCTGRAEHAHHVLRRGQGGADELGNLLDCCRACHEWIHAHVDESYERGWLRRRWTS